MVDMLPLQPSTPSSLHPDNILHCVHFLPNQPPKHLHTRHPKEVPCSAALRSTDWGCSGASLHVDAQAATVDLIG